MWRRIEGFWDYEKGQALNLRKRNLGGFMKLKDQRRKKDWRRGTRVERGKGFELMEEKDS